MKTIVALSTPKFKSAIHIIRISGDKTYEILQKISKTKIKKEGYSIQKVDLFDNSQKIDEVLLNKFVAPKSYTGENLVEINCHGSLYIANKIISLLIKNGCIMAKNGEFTKRAFLNNKISLIQSEAINNLVNSSSDIGIKMSLNGLDGKTNKAIKQIRDNIFKVLGQVEVDIDYPEYESTPDVSKKEILNIFKKSIVLINKIIKSSNKLIKIKDGIRVAIIGKPNVGKSSLLNALLKEDKAIVSTIPGTTRDVIEASCVIDGIKFDFVDTAGIRKSNNSIEKIGITKAKNAYKNADLILLVIDNSKKITEQDKSLLSKTNKLNRIVVLNKSDKSKANSISGIKISAKTNNISALIKKLSNFNNLQSIDFKNEILMQSQQSINLLESALLNIKLAQKIYLSNKEFEISANYLHNAINKLEQILGISNNVSFVDELFSKFCVGK